jgi:predicted AlkP superfamily pyrophosphatase or phosphodiesterase
MYRLIPVVLISLLVSSCISVKATSTKQIKTTTSTVAPEISVNTSRPKLVVGIVVDQMRYDYLPRFSSRFGEDGFKRLMKQGYFLENVHFDYIPTKTAAGHASVYSGTTPAVHGILGNDWFDKYNKRSVYCVGDDRYEAIGASTGGKKSPHRLLTSTITDQLHLSQNMNGKVISISLKDRGAILPGGHTANAAYWFEGNTVGRFISSTYYMDKAPSWVTEFNNSGTIDNYLNQTWNTLYPLSTYAASLADSNLYERTFKGKPSTTFPYELAKLRKLNKEYDLIKEVPAGNSIVTDFAIAALKNESLGQDGYTDFLAISYSSTDYIGHMFGPRSVELEDTYLRLDQEIAQLLAALDQQVGPENYTLFLSADHAVVDVPAYLQSLNIPAGYIKKNELRTFVNDITEKYFASRELVADISNDQIFLDHDKIDSLGLSYDLVVERLTHEVLTFPSVSKSFSAKTLSTNEFTRGVPRLLQNGFHQKFSGDILLILNPSTISRGSRTGTTHGSGFTYDTHVPLFFFGKGIKPGRSDKYYPITSITATLSSFLNLSPPEGCTTEPILAILEE